MIIGVLLVAVFGLLFIVYRSIKKTGKQEAILEKQEKVIEDAYISKVVRDNLRKSHNNDAAIELRKKYQRD